MKAENPAPSIRRRRLFDPKARKAFMLVYSRDGTGVSAVEQLARRGHHVASPGDVGLCRQTQSTTATWTENITPSCDTGLRLYYCVEQ